MLGQRILITGGTGSFGHAFVRRLLERAGPSRPARIVIYSRDEAKQQAMRMEFANHAGLRFFLGDVRDLQRLRLAFRGVDIVVHAAALKQVEACEYNPSEAVATNIGGTQNVAVTAIECGVKRVVALSSDKAVAPLNLYGATKSAAEALIRAANSYSSPGGTRLAAVRYGNVAGSRGSVIPLWRAALAAGAPLQITDPDATRFWFTLDGAVGLVEWTLEHMRGGELVVPELSAFRVRDLAAAMTGGAPTVIVGPRVGDKTHESMIGADEATYFRRWQGRLIRFLPGDDRGESLEAGFVYRSDLAPRMSVQALRWALAAIP